MTPPGRSLPRLLLPILLVLLAAPLLAGCVTGPDGDTDPVASPTETPTGSPGNGGDLARWTNPYAFTLHFDGEAAYDLALQQLYRDPEEKTGPRYRIPGTADHQEVAAELLAHLEDAMQDLDGAARFQTFTGDDYYALDHGPVSSYTCANDPSGRDAVRSLEFHNVVGRTDPDRVGMIIGAHWDTKRHAMGSDEPILGADDGAASTAAVVELARAFAAAPVDLPLTFILFDGEDGFEDCHPLAGSLYYAQNLSPDEKATVEGMILLDMIGNVSARFYHESNSRNYHAPSGAVSGQHILDHVWGTAAEMEVEAFVDRNIRGVLDDHIPFLHEGLPAIDIIRYDGNFAPYWHTTADDETVIQPEGIEQVGVVVEASLRLWTDRTE